MHGPTNPKLDQQETQIQETKTQTTPAGDGKPITQTKSYY